jgi:hypothetical protein
MRQHPEPGIGTEVQVRGERIAGKFQSSLLALEVMN